MTREEIYKELKMTYDELQVYLIQKYGGAVCDYFTTPECRSKSKKVSRTKEGLYCHHMDEDKGGNLSSPIGAIHQPFEWQRKERLVYCNILEHLILHIKIAILRQKGSLEKPRDILRFFTTGGIFMICEEINDMFINKGTEVEWKKRCFEEVKDNYKDYVILVKAILAYVENNYIGVKDEEAFLVPGSIVHFADCDCEILKVNRKKNIFCLKLPTGEEKSLKSDIAMDQFTYIDYINKVAGNMASGYDTFYVRIYENILDNNSESEVLECSNLFKVDYTGHGYASYANIVLGEEYGAKNADIYIAKALPMHSAMTYDLEDKKVVFWKGSKIPTEAHDSFYIVQIETMFNIKEGCVPFVRYRERDFLRVPFMRGTNNNHNMKDEGWTILSTSDVYDKATDKYYSKYYDRNGELVDAKVILTLGKDDYFLFQEKHNIKYLKVLNGCYFC